MITAKCLSADCQQNGIKYNCEGSHAYIECGTCATPCELSDERPDPETATDTL